VHEVLQSRELRAAWLQEVASMRARIGGLRGALVAQLQRACPGRDFSFIARQKGMFSYLGVSADLVRELRERHHVYMTDDSRMNIAGLRSDNIAYFAGAVAEVLRK
jgi:aspartate aminotransferase